MKKNNKIINIYISQFLLLLLSSLLASLSHPNFINQNGFGFLAWFSYLPLIFVVKKSNIKKVWLDGLLYSILFCTFFGFWLFNYGILSYILIVLYNIFLYISFFYLIKLVIFLFPKNNWIVLWLLLSSFEYIKTLGFFGFNYGVLAYSQWKYIPVIQIVDIIGVFGLNLLIIFPSCCLYKIISNKIGLKNYKNYLERNLKQFEYESHFTFLKDNEREIKKYSNLSSYLYMFVFIICFIFVFIYSSIINKNQKDYKTIKVAAVQNCDSPEEYGLSSYVNSFQTLYTLSNSLLEMNDNVSFILWPENSIVPSIFYKYNLSQKKNELIENDIKTQDFIKSVLNYFSSKQNVTFVIGNNHIEEEQNELKYYNSVLIFDNQTIYNPLQTKIYKKNYLVPLSEGFPYKSIFPDIYNKLYKKFDYLYEYGTEFTVFHSNDFSYSTPICFEDTIPQVAREMYKNGSRCLFNLTNDSWAKSKVSQFQHLAISVFRSVENRIPLVRSATSGQSCIISCKGEISQMIPPFNKYYVVGEIPVIPLEREETIYSKFGHYIFEQGLLFFTFLLLIIRIITVIIKKTKKVQ